MRTEDLDRIVEIEREGFLHPWSRDLLEREMSHAWSHVIVAIEEERGEERIVGYLVFWLVHDEIHVLNLGIAMASRRRGVGRALMEEAHTLGRSRGAALSTLEVRRSNVAALELYRDLGYRQVGVRPNYYAEEGEDAIVMVRDLAIG
jgi:ribosomal-protein-alanine N-acetyltransferase